MRSVLRPRGRTFGRNDRRSAVAWNSLHRKLAEPESAPAITDGAHALKRELAIASFNPASLEGICLNGIPFSEPHAGPRVGCRWRPRDRSLPQGQSRVARRTPSRSLARPFYTYAKAFELYDQNHFANPLAVLRHLVAMSKFSTAVHGNPVYPARYITSAIRRVCSYVAAPFALVSYALTRKHPCAFTFRLRSFAARLAHGPATAQGRSHRDRGLKLIATTRQVDPATAQPSSAAMRS